MAADGAEFALHRAVVIRAEKLRLQRDQAFLRALQAAFHNALVSAFSGKGG